MIEYLWYFVYDELGHDLCLWCLFYLDFSEMQGTNEKNQMEQDIVNEAYSEVRSDLSGKKLKEVKYSVMCSFLVFW